MAEAPLSEAPATAIADPIPEGRLLRLPMFAELEPDGIAEAVSAAAAAGFNGVIVPLTLGGIPIFPSPAARQCRMAGLIPEFRKRDVLGEASELARRSGLLLYGLTNPWRPDEAGTLSLAHHWIQRRPDWFASKGGSLRRLLRHPREELWHCPTNVESRRYLGDVWGEALEGYPLEGLILDAREFPWGPGSGAGRCACKNCRRAAGEAQLDPDLLQRPGPLGKAGEDWILGIARQSMGYWRQRCHKSRENVNLRLICRAFGSDDEEGGVSKFGLTERLWRDWLSEGLIDGLHIDGLPGALEGFPDAVDLNLARWPDDTLLYPVIECGEADQLPERIGFLRERPLTGCSVEWAGPLSAVASEELAGSRFAAPSYVAERDPVHGLRALCEDVSRLAPPESGVSEFLSDLLLFISAPNDRSALDALEAVVENIRGLESRILQGQVDFGDGAARALCRLSQAKRVARLKSRWTSI